MNDNINNNEHKLIFDYINGNIDKSYKQLYLNSMTNKNNCKLIIREYATKMSGQTVFDYVTLNERLCDYVIPRNCNSVTMPSVIDEKNLEYLSLALYNSNVTDVSGYQPTKSGPLSHKLKSIVWFKLKTLEPGSFFEGLTTVQLWNVTSIPVGVLPLSLRKFTVGSIKEKLVPGCFPNGLVELSITGHNYNSFEPGVLPLSLRRLTGSVKLSTLTTPLKLTKGSLPPNLEFFSFDPLDPLDDDVDLPMSLDTLKIAPFSWIPKIRVLSNLRRLELVGHTDSRLAFGDIPNGVYSLLISNCSFNGNVLPLSVKHLHLVDCEYSFTAESGGVQRQLDKLILSGTTRFNNTLFTLKIALLDLREYQHPLNVQEEIAPSQIEQVKFSSKSLSKIFADQTMVELPYIQQQIIATKARQFLESKFLLSRSTNFTKLILTTARTGQGWTKLRLIDSNGYYILIGKLSFHLMVGIFHESNCTQPLKNLIVVIKYINYYMIK
ncbi:hypothetical protein PPL_01257 [Heterostelium album PN500]|uniref:FNIP repeat-containing protein n=1 Tax=Heterostelium pallidum (strain ATCC 26659 / Pp 5 / PN500) TaxID=670386 RepID=D3AYJ7_HETP5|nr:hypothetical protein PPL_01257 [Heterostelium album PN500]EFA86024.1 hypothetical protein PPL_01257 [Heterostelium album PN500]|eukprot:XP_020438130.1 hypothetical protein PPL_01257 [Heterostelium album PN500]